MFAFLCTLETVSFVKTLFEVLQNNSYIPAPPKPTTPLPAEPIKQISPPKPTTQPKPIIQTKSISPPKQVSLPKPNNPPRQGSISPVIQSSVPKSTNPPLRSSISPQQSNLPSPPRPVNERLLSTDESLRPQAAEVGLSFIKTYETEKMYMYYRRPGPYGYVILFYVYNYPKAGNFLTKNTIHKIIPSLETKK